MAYWRGVLIATLLLVAAGAARGADTDPQAQTTSFHKTVSPLLEQYCYECHGNGKHESDLALDSFKTVADIDKNRAAWEAVLTNVHKGDMPPPEAKAHPSKADRDVITDWLEQYLYNYDPKNPDPGRVTIRRLNRAEYNNTIRDLVGVDFKPAEDFPSDDSGYGFDDIGDVLSLPPILMEKYLAAATKVLDTAIVTEPIPSKTRHFKANLMEMGFNADGDRGDGWMPLGALEEDGLATAIDVTAGDYIVRVTAFVKSSGPMILSLMLDDSVVCDWKVDATEAKPGVYQMRLGVPAGRHRFKVVNRRIRGGDDELLIKNGRIGAEQSGTIWVNWVDVIGPVAGATRRYPAATLASTGVGRNLPDGSRVLDKNGEVALKVNIPAAGDYIFRTKVTADQAGVDYVKMDWRINGKPVQTVDVIAPEKLIPVEGQQIFSTELLNALPYVYEIHQKLPAGEVTVSTAFTNELSDPTNDDPNLVKRDLRVFYIEAVGLNEAQPLPPMPAPLQRFFTDGTKPGADKTANARGVLSLFARSAWRRPVASSELDGLMGLFAMADKNGDSFEAAMKLPLKAVLVSPNFLFRGEMEPEPNNPKTVYPIDEFALASRLSYFLWSSTPDDELLGLAERGELRKNLDAQVKRMLASPKSEALVENFAGQWLQIRNLEFVAPDKTLFPDFDDELRDSMLKETQLFFNSIMREDHSVMDFVTGDYTFVNERLATHYGIKNITGSEFQRVSLIGTPRRGLLSQASILTITSNPTRTSPVKRGKWVLDNLLGQPPPPPPPDVPALVDDGKPLTGTLRQQMEAHRVNPTCMSCHAQMDPLGFGLENFDAVGQVRAKDGNFPIDVSGKLVTGETFNGSAELSTLLATSKRDDFIRCLSDKMLTYALGRGTEYYDRPAIDKIADGLDSDGDKFSRLITEVVNSLPFQMRRGDGSVASK